MLFQIGDYAVCPGHGVGFICDIEERDLGTHKAAFYKIKIISNGMMIMVPTGSSEGIRELVNNDGVKDVYEVLSNHDVSVDNSTWNRRYREYMAKVKTGSLIEIAEVLRALFLLKKKKSLSFGEKKMLEQCKELLAQEISIADGREPQEIKFKIDSCFEKSA